MERAAADLSEEDDEDESGGGARSVRVSRRLQRRCGTIPHSSSFRTDGEAEAVVHAFFHDL